MFPLHLHCLVQNSVHTTSQKCIIVATLTYRFLWCVCANILAHCQSHTVCFRYQKFQPNTLAKFLPRCNLHLSANFVKKIFSTSKYCRLKSVDLGIKVSEKSLTQRFDVTMIPLSSEKIKN